MNTLPLINTLLGTSFENEIEAINYLIKDDFLTLYQSKDIAMIGTLQSLGIPPKGVALTEVYDLLRLTEDYMSEGMKMAVWRSEFARVIYYLQCALAGYSRDLKNASKMSVRVLLETGSLGKHYNQYHSHPFSLALNPVFFEQFVFTEEAKALFANVQTHTLPYLVEEGEIQVQVTPDVVKCLVLNLLLHVQTSSYRGIEIPKNWGSIFHSWMKNFVSRSNSTVAVQAFKQYRKNQNLYTAEHLLEALPPSREMYFEINKVRSIEFQHSLQNEWGETVLITLFYAIEHNDFYLIHKAATLYHLLYQKKV